MEHFTYYERTPEISEPFRLKILAFDVKDYKGNNLLHRFVLNNGDRNDRKRAKYIHAVLLSMAGLPADRLNELNWEGSAALHLAVFINDPLMVEKLLSCLYEIDVNAKSPYMKNATALQIATNYGYVDIISELLKKNGLSKPNVLSSITVVVEKDDSKTLKCFAENGAADIIKEKKSDFLIFAASNGKLDILKYFVGKRYVDSKEISELLVWAAQSESLETVEFLVSSGANVNARGDKRRPDRTPLYIAAASCLRIVEYLVERGADVNAKVYHQTPLHEAVANNYKDIAEFLITKGANVNALTNLKDTPLSYALRKGYLDLVKLLVKYGADVNIHSHDKNSPFLYAIDETSLEMVEFFVRNGADVNGVSFGRTPLSIALCRFWALTFKRRHWEDEQTLSASIQIIEFLVKNDADVNIVCCEEDICLETPLHVAVDANSFELVKFLIENGADVNARGNYGRTPYKKAARLGYHRIGDLLRARGADVNA